AAQPKQTEEKKDQAMTTQTPAGNPENVIPILMPQAGQSMEEGTILSWKIKPGDTIEVGQVIMEIETDKATMEVEAPDAGRVARIIAAEGDIIEVKKPVAFIAADDADVDAYLGGAPALPPQHLLQPLRRLHLLRQVLLPRLPQALLLSRRFLCRKGRLFRY
ncbi:MAG: lipoyl domain-containing protein, partial [Planctomycetota bacterium]